GGTLHRNSGATPARRRSGMPVRQPIAAGMGGPRPSRPIGGTTRGRGRGAGIADTRISLRRNAQRSSGPGRSGAGAEAGRCASLPGGRGPRRGARGLDRTPAARFRQTRARPRRWRTGRSRAPCTLAPLACDRAAHRNRRMRRATARRQRGHAARQSFPTARRRPRSPVSGTRGLTMASVTGGGRMSWPRVLGSFTLIAAGAAAALWGLLLIALILLWLARAPQGAIARNVSPPPIHDPVDVAMRTRLASAQSELTS